MRLLQLQDGGEFRLVEREGNNIPRYAILSHTWGLDGEEVTFQDITDNTYKSKPGYEKILFCGQQAKQDSLHYFWVDTCCIDKSSSQELSEAINSMFYWYRSAERCYAYLADVSDDTSSGYSECSKRWKPAFKKSRWFTRGWTLQELIAPSSVEFFSKEGTCLGNKQSLETTLHEITGIAPEALRGSSLSQFSTEERFSWAEKRITTRGEDAAYCLLGIFDIQMPLLYAEGLYAGGREKALKRLRKEIREHSDDHALSLNAEQHQTLLESLRFDQIDARQSTIKIAHAKTCKWLYKKTEYLEWLDNNLWDDHHGFLWIRGKPGAGKSTLMKFILAQARNRMKDKITIFFFFNARGADMEKSTIGTYRSLLLQLLERLPALRYVFNSLGLLNSSISPDYQWSAESLKFLLEQIIQNLGDSSVVCYIDALDECEEWQVRDMMQFFERIGEITMSSGIHFRVCFSSRHYPHVTIHKGLSLVLEGQEGHSQDITNYLESELKIGQSKDAQQIRLKLQDKAKGVFMWVVLVVSILNKEYDRGRIYALRKRLKEIPGDLYRLFRDILTRDSQNRDELVLSIQWVLFAKEPLSPEQLYFAVLSGIEPGAVSKWDPSEVTEDVIKRFILDSSKGLAEITKSKRRTVQFIHESVRDFFLKEDGLGNVWPSLRSNLQGQSHERLKHCCLTYMDLDVYADLEIPEKLPKASSQEATDFRKSATDEYPFLEYAVGNVLYHANAAEGSGITQANLFYSFPRSQWIKLSNLLEKRQIRRHKNGMTLLYLFAEYNMSNLVRIHPSVLQCLDVENERYGLPLLAAIATKSKEALWALVEGLAADQITRMQPSELYKEICQYEDMEERIGRNFEFSHRRCVLVYLLAYGNTTLVDIVLETGKIDVNATDMMGWKALPWVAERGHDAMVELLLHKNVDVNAKGGRYGNALQAVSYQGHEQIVKLLLDKGANVNAQGGEYDNALYAASYEGHEQIVKLLLDKGANVDAQGGKYGSALYAASYDGHEQIVKLLLNKGANVNAYDGKYGSALQAASSEGHEMIVELLLSKGANVNATGTELYGSALQAASFKGYEQIVKLLLDKGANVNAHDIEYGSALQAASSEGHEKIVELLLNKGANVNALGGNHGSAIQAASCGGHEQIVKLLLYKDADVNLKGGGLHNSALLAASGGGHEQIVKLLLNKDAHINERDDDIYCSALQAASFEGHEQIVKLLLDKGANVNAQGGVYGSALRAASSRGYEQIVKLLLDKGANVNVLSGNHGSALKAASCGGHEQIVKLLRDKGKEAA
jgi:ankyrin repeat protein